MADAANTRTALAETPVRDRSLSDDYWLGRSPSPLLRLGQKPPPALQTKKDPPVDRKPVRSRFDSIQWPNSKSRTILAPRLRGIVGKAQPVLKPLISGEDLRLPFVRRLRFGRGSLAICGHCGRKLRTHYTSRTASPGYHCAGASASAPCRSTRLWAAPDRNRAGLGQPAVAPLLPVPTMGETL
jgi:hypothetical protein